MKTITMEMPPIGSVDITLSDEQIEKCLYDGKLIFHKLFGTVQYYRRSGTTTSNVPNTLTGQDVDWSNRLSKITANDISETLALAKQKESDNRKNAKIACSLVTMAIVAYNGGDYSTLKTKVKELISEEKKNG